ncbi:type IV pilin [Pseudomonadales bacterium]|nr:type IV pilin [Pseudomonadales bacterium]
MPSYQGQVRDGRRADGTAVLLQARQLMERHYSKNYDYGTPAAVGIPAKSPIDGTASYYAITLAAAATTFTLTATPQGGQVGDGCGVLTINQAGVKTAADGTVDACWR